MTIFNSLEKKLVESNLLELENSLQVTFPQDYKDFLLQYNVGISEEKYLSILIDEINESVVLGAILGCSDNENFDLVDWNIEYRSELPENSFIFATEAGGGLFVMLVDGENNGVYFWDHSFIFDSSSEESNVYFLAKDFTSFIKRLTV